MEKKSNLALLIPIEELQSKFKSKLDLYRVMSIDMNYFLAPYGKCPVSFLRSILGGEKKAIKNIKAGKVCVPKYRERLTRSIWEYIKEIPDLLDYFPDYTEKQCPDKDYLFSLVGALRGDELSQLISDARKKRSIHETPDINELVEVDEEILKELQEVFAQKTTRGKACFMLKKRAKLKQSRRYPAQYSTDLKILENKEGQDESHLNQHKSPSLARKGDVEMLSKCEEKKK